MKLTDKDIDAIEKRLQLLDKNDGFCTWNQLNEVIFLGNKNTINLFNSRYHFFQTEMNGSRLLDNGNEALKVGVKKYIRRYEFNLKAKKYIMWLGIIIAVITLFFTAISAYYSIYPKTMVIPINTTVNKLTK